MEGTDSYGVELIKYGEKSNYDINQYDGYIAEKYIHGEDLSVESISFGGRHYILTMTFEENSGRPYFFEVSHIVPAPSINKKLELKIKKRIKKYLTALKIDNTIAHTEIKVDYNSEDVFYRNSL